MEEERYKKHKTQLGTAYFKFVQTILCIILRKYPKDEKSCVWCGW